MKRFNKRRFYVQCWNLTAPRMDGTRGPRLDGEIGPVTGLEAVAMRDNLWLATDMFRNHYTVRSI